jgi:hypothetical protein
MARKKSKGIELSVFKGREAKLNRAILKVLTKKSPQTIYEIHKQVIQTKALKSTRYGNVNARVKALEETGYVRNNGLRTTKAGFKANLYESTARAYFAFVVSSLDIDDLIHELDEISMLTLLGVIVARQ